MQHKERPVHMKSAEKEWPALGLDGGVFILLHLIQDSSLLSICSTEKHTVVQGRSNSLEMIEI